MKKLINLLLLLAVCFVPFNVLAEVSRELQIVNSSSETKYLENDQGYITKKIVASDPKNGEVTIELEVTNKSSNVESQVIVKENSEIVIVLDESGSMSTTIDYENDLSRFDVVTNAAKELVNNILSNSTSAKIGTISFATEAVVTSELTSDLDALNTVYSSGRVKNGLTYTTDALTLAETVFSEADVPKIIILLTDGAPSDDTTKDKLIELSNKGYYIITMLSDDDSVSSDVFGTMENPTAGKLYLIEDSEITTIIKDNIFADVIEYIKQNESITNVTVTDYFPADITDNFEFSYVSKPTNGVISESISDNKTITYTLDELKGNESIKISYKLKLKDMNDDALLNKVIATNEKVVLDYTDKDTKTYNVVLSSSPSIKLVEVKDEVVESPKTGLKEYTLSIISLIVVSGTILYIKRKKNYIKNI